jgi:hypothetical protein
MNYGVGWHPAIAILCFRRAGPFLIMNSTPAFVRSSSFLTFTPPFQVLFLSSRFLLEGAYRRELVSQSCCE